MDEPLIKKSPMFHYHTIGRILPRYNVIYNLGWGNLSEEMLLNSPIPSGPDIDLLRSYGDPNGIEELRLELCKYLNARSDVKISQDNILVTNGATNGIFLAGQYCKKYLNISDMFLQNPSYDTAVNTFRSQGFNLNDFEYANFDFLLKQKDASTYLMLKFHNPTGLYVGKDEREKLIKNLLNNNMFVIEDDAYGLYDGNGEFSFTLNKNYLFVGSLSKYVFPGLRVGFIVGDPTTINSLSMIQRYYNSYPSPFGQTAALDYLKTGKINNEVAHKINLVKSNRKSFEKSISPFVKSLIKDSVGGFYYWLELPDYIESVSLFHKLIRQGVFVIPGAIYAINKGNNSIRVSISNISSSEVTKAAAILSQTIDKLRSENAKK